MGNCFTSSDSDETPLPPEEKVITQYSSSLGFHHHPVPASIQEIQRNSSNGKLTEEQFNTVAFSLHLTLVELDTIDSKHFIFFKQIKDKGSYVALKLCALVLLLGKGSVAEKAGPMFDALPGVSNGEANEGSLRALWEAMITIAAEALPVLAIEEQPVPNKSLSDSACRNYIGQLVPAKEQLVSELVGGALYGSTRIRKPDFQERLKSMPVFQTLGSPERIRAVLYAKTSQAQRHS